MALKQVYDITGRPFLVNDNEIVTVEIITPLTVYNIKFTNNDNYDFDRDNTKDLVGINNLNKLDNA